MRLNHTYAILRDFGLRLFTYDGSGSFMGKNAAVSMSYGCLFHSGNPLFFGIWVGYYSSQHKEV